MSSDIPVVQGTVVQGTVVESSQPYVAAGNDTTASSDDFNNYGFSGQQQGSSGFENGEYGSGFNGVKGEKQPKKYKDGLFAVLFISHLLIMVVVLSMYSSGNENSASYGGIIYCVAMCGVFAIGLATVALGVMMQFARELVKISLIFSVISSLVVALLGFAAGQVMMGVMGLLGFGFGICYATMVWQRIPFAAANLNTALAAVKANLGLAVVAYIFLAIAFAWSIWWSMAAGNAFASVGTAVVFLFLVSYYWTHQVLQNTVHVTVAGVVGTWWFVPEEASSFWSPSLNESFVRSTTYSFGSICLGSLLVAIVQALRQLHHMLRDNEEFNFLICIVDCILGCIESIIEYLNKWAYIYVGLYGYSYLEAGSNVITLFQNKGWTAIITDDLVDNVLFMVSIVIGLITGVIGLILGSMDANMFAGEGFEDAKMAGFIIGLFVGFLFSSILMGVVSSAVNTVIVCYAESPAEFQQNHPELSNEMREAWVQAWPAECSNI